MASAASLPIAFARLFATRMIQVDDPGASGTIYVQNKGIAICEVVTAAGESRALPAAGAFGIGTLLLVIGKTLGGTLTVTGADVNPTLTANGDAVLFIVSDVNGVVGWRVAFQTKNTSQNALIRLQDGVRNLTSVAKSTTATISAAQMLGGYLIADTTSAGFTATFDTAANLVAAIPSAAVGDRIEFIASNAAGGNTLTMAADGSNTHVGTLTVATTKVRKFVIVLTNVTASSEAYTLLGLE